MYYIAFFINRQALLKEKLSSFLKNNFSDVWICQDQQESQLRSLDDLPLHPDYWYSQAWYLHGQYLNQTTVQSSITKFPVYTGPDFKVSFKEIDTALSWLSTKYLWAFFPWGGPKKFSAFGFLSTERMLHDQFVDSFHFSPNRVEKVNGDGSFNTFVSSYNVTTNFCELIQAILFSGYDKPAQRLWDICNCNATPLWLITDLFDEDVFSIFSWKPARYELIQPLTIKESRPLGVYQPHDKESFESMCMLSTQEPDTLICVPQDTDLEKLKNLLAKTEDYNSYSDLTYLQDILTVTKWFYGLDRDRADYGNSLFASQDSSLLQKFNELDQNDDYRLISCF